MKVPEFTADSSLYRTSRLYKTQTNFGATAQRVVPQRIKLKDVHCACDSRSDICVCDDGSVFNDVTGLLDLF